MSSVYRGLESMISLSENKKAPPVWEEVTQISALLMSAVVF